MLPDKGGETYEEEASLHNTRIESRDYFDRPWNANKFVRNSLRLTKIKPSTNKIEVYNYKSLVKQEEKASLACVNSGIVAKSLIRSVRKQEISVVANQVFVSSRL